MWDEINTSAVQRLVVERDSFGRVIPKAVAGYIPLGASLYGTHQIFFAIKFTEVYNQSIYRMFFHCHKIATMGLTEIWIGWLLPQSCDARCNGFVPGGGPYIAYSFIQPSRPPEAGPWGHKPLLGPRSHTASGTFDKNGCSFGQACAHCTGWGWTKGSGCVFELWMFDFLKMLQAQFWRLTSFSVFTVLGACKLPLYI